MTSRNTPAPRFVQARSRRTAVTVLLATLLLAGCGTGDSPDRLQQTSSPLAGVDAATRDDAQFATVFTHETAQAEDVTMHYVTGGSGEPLVLLHGWPQTWYGWRDIMPSLAEHHTVYALDLPGLGDSEGSPAGYDKATLARYVHGLLVDELGLGPVNLAAHDLGAGVGFQYAAQFPQDVIRYAHLDYPLPGPALSAQEYRAASWHMAFHTQDDFPETLVGDDVREYIDLFTGYVAHDGTSFGGPGAPSPFSAAELDEFARTYSNPEPLTGGFDLYRTLDQDERDNIAATPVAVPTLLLAAEGTLPFMRASVEPVLTDIVEAREVPGAGHWLVEENPEFVTRELLGFFAGADQ